MNEVDARQQINDALLTYCRGIDRLDGALVAAAFHPGAELLDYGPEPTTIEAFVDRAITSLGTKFTATQHRISNTRIEFSDGGAKSDDGAQVETYVLAFHVESADSGELLHTFNGRYIDNFTEQDGHWRILRRTLRNDWSKVESIEERMGGSWPASGRGGSPDPLQAYAD